MQIPRPTSKWKRLRQSLAGKRPVPGDAEPEQGSELRYRSIFEQSPVSLWEQDYSEIFAYLDELRSRGVRDFRDYFEKHPDQLAVCAQKITVLNVNQATVDLYQADSKESLLGELIPSFTNRPYAVLREILLVLAGGGRRFESEVKIQTQAGEVRDVSLQLYLLPGPAEGEAGEARALLSLSDISERKRAETMLREFIQTTGPGYGTELFDAMALQLSQSLKADVVLIGELRGDEPTRVSSMALVVDGKRVDPVDYALAGTPCENVLASGICAYPEGVADKFPEDEVLAELGAQAYVGVPLIDSGGRLLGVLSLIYRQALPSVEWIESYLRVFASRIQHELERLQAEQALRKSELRFKNLFDTTPVCIKELDPSGRIMVMNQFGMDLLGVNDLNDVAGMAMLDMVAPKDKSRVNDALRQAQSGVASSFEFTGAGAAGGMEISSSFTPVTGADGQLACILSVSEEITERVRFEQFTQQQASLAEALLELPQKSDEMDALTFIQHGLRVLEDLTDSNVSFLHSVDEQAQSISNVTLSRRTLETHGSRLVELSRPVWNRGIWGETLASRQATVVNDLNAHQPSSGHSTRIAGLKRLLVLPIIDNGMVEMLVGVANRDSDYGKQEVETLRLFANQMWRIIQRRRAEDRAYRFNWVLEKSLHEIYIFDSQTLRYLHVNEGARKNLGYAAEELRHMTPLDVMPETGESTFVELVEHMRSGASAKSELTTVHRRKDGTEYPVEVTLELINQVPPVVVALVRDIGDRVQMEQELIKLALAVEQSPVSILIANTDSEIEYVNDAFVRTTGYSRREVVGKNPDVLAAEWSGADDYRAIWRSLKNGQSWEGEFNHRRKDGTDLIAHESITPIRQPDGELTHYLVIREDITEKKRLMQELQDHRDHLEELVAMRTRELSEAREQAEAAGRVKSQFLANMSHEIRTPINSVLGLTYLLRQSDMSAGQHRRLDQIESSTKHLISVINDILDLSKIEAGKVALEQDDFDLGALMSHVEPMLRDQAEAKGLKLYTEPAEISQPVSGDKRRLLQVLLNYAHNAIKFTERGEICLRALVAEESAEHILVRFEVQDTGIGVEPDKLPHVFEAFEQADASTTRVHGGTGLGLAIAAHLAQLMGGEVGAESELGKGSTFWFTARLKPAAQAEQPFLEKSAGALSRLRKHPPSARVLLVEDDRINLEVVYELLVHAGLSVDTAEGPREALARAHERQYDLILMDVQMPGMDGLEATQKIRSGQHHQSTPVLGMSANTSPEQRAACLAAGMDGFVAKPIDPDLLFASLLKWLPERGELPETSQPQDGAGSGSAGQGSADAASPIDGGVLRSLLGDDQDRHLEILRKFSSQAAGIIEDLQAACQARDASAVQFQSHKLKSSAGTVGARSVLQFSQALEAAGKEQDWAQVTALFAQISAELQRVSEYINGQ